jgi:hypothetical protein
MTEVLHEDTSDDPRNLTAEEYEATYNDGPWCGPSAEEVAAAEKAAQ